MENKKVKMKKAVQKLNNVLILDTHRGIYFGELVEIFNEGKSVRLKNMRHVFYFASHSDSTSSGVYALATIGCADGSRIGPPVDCTINDVSKIVEASDAAAKKFESAKWS